MRRIAETVAAAMPKFDYPELRLFPELSRSLVDFDRAFAPMRDAVASIVDRSELTRLLIDPDLIGRLRALVAQRMPPNWSDVADWRVAARLVKETGWAIIWAPRPEVVSALLNAQPEAREGVLLDHAALIVEDAIACANEVRRDELVFLADCIVEIGNSINEGRCRSAQALAASVLTELIQGILGHEELSQARAEFSERWEEKSIHFLRFALITSAIPLALSRFYRQKGDPIPASFNRHAVAHGASPTQFTPLNALVGLLLVSGLTRELHALYDEGLLHDEE